MEHPPPLKDSNKIFGINKSVFRAQIKVLVIQDLTKLKAKIFCAASDNL